MNRLTSFIDAGNVYGDSLLSHALLNAPHGNSKKSVQFNWKLLFFFTKATFIYLKY